MKKSLTALLLALLAIVLVPSGADALEVNFDEVILPSLTLLDGTNHYDPFGLNFADTTLYAVDTRFVEDDFGITNTGGPNNLVTVLFNAPTSFVDFTWLTISAEALRGQAFNAANVLLDTFLVNTPGGDTSGNGLLSGPGITRVTWNDNTGQFGIDSLRFDVDVPEPASLMLIGIGLVAVSISRRRRNG